MECLTYENVKLVKAGDIIIFDKSDMFEFFNDAYRFVKCVEHNNLNGYILYIHFLSCNEFHNKCWYVTKEDLVNYTNYVIRL